jgi:hypothetical protein
MKHSSIIIYTVTSMLLLTACENPMSFKTVVHEDGSIDKTLVIKETEKFRADHNLFGIHSGNGWNVDITPADSAKEKYRLVFNKHFNSVEEVNRDLDQPVDSLFQIHSTFEKKFRWFYTYINYSETIRPLNRFKIISPDDYFNQEDHTFINRLPGEGTPISKADSVFLEVLSEKISERFVEMAIYYEVNQIIKDVITRNNLDKKWLDTLERKRELVYNMIEKDKGENNLPEKIADSLAIPLPKPKASKDFEELTENFDARIAFMSFAHDGKYTNEVYLPWEIVNSNADSVAGTVAVWQPLSTKFAISEYVMYAECRKMNLWAVLVSVGVVLITIFLFFRKTKS